MRLLNTENLRVEEFRDSEVEPYAILSHTWHDDEVTFQDMENRDKAKIKKGYEKVKECSSLAKPNRFKYIWIDTCCIDKRSSAELSEAINSMYRWYQEADVCYAYLADVESKSEFSNSKWFTRGWTLQELIAPSRVKFLNKKWRDLGTKKSLRQDVSDCTGIPVGILTGDNDLETFSVAQRMSWAAKRETSRIEDRAYCLLGIFRINMSLIYGEGETAFIRLQEEIMKVSADHSLFAWKSVDNRGGLLATSPAAFIDSNNIVQFSPFDTFNSPLTVSSKGINLEVRFIGMGPRGVGLAILHCKERGGEDEPIAIYVQDLFLTMDQFERVWSQGFKRLDLKEFRPSQYPMRRIWIRQKRHMTRAQKSGDLERQDMNAPEIYSNDALLKKFGERTALLRAVEKGLEDDVWLLLTRSDVEVNLKDEDGWTALSHAVRGARTAVVKMLLARSDIKADLGNKDGGTLLSLAARLGHDAVVELLLMSNKFDAESEDTNRRTPLSWAAESGHEVVVQSLLDKRANIESEDTNGRTPLSWAAGNGHEAVVRLLLEKGANIESEDTNGRRPLSWVAGNGHEAVVRLLLEKGANIESEDTNGRRPLSWAAGNGHKAVVRLLLEKGANIESEDKNGRTPLTYAVGNRHEAVVRLLLSWAAENRRDAAGRLLLPACWRIDTRGSPSTDSRQSGTECGLGHHKARRSRRFSTSSTTQT
jgi:ankyrin repeat protein